jgi:hypothetical protein
MTIYYANLNLTATGGDGSEGDPWHADTFQTQINAQLPNGSIINIQGLYQFATDLHFVSSTAGGLILQNWLPNEPWRISSPGISSSTNNKFYNAVINISGGSGHTLTFSNAALPEFYDCFINCPSTLTIVDSLATFKGSTLIIAENGLRVDQDDGPGSAALTDCILSCTLTGSYWNNVNSNNCCFTAASIPGAGTHVSPQVNWTPPSWPAWNAAQSAFSSTLLSANITTPEPGAGYPSYTGYATGLWGTPRTGIGAMDFGAASLSITTQPASQTVALGGTLTLIVAATGGSSPYAYQWKKDSSNIQDATFSSYSKGSFAKSDAGLYKALVSDSTGSSIFSNDATVKYPLTIDTQPLSQTIALGGILGLSVAASGGTSPYTYQWQKGVGDITDATFSSYTKTNFAESDATTYKVLVTGSDSSTVLSNGAIIKYPVHVDTQPLSQAVPLNSSVTLTVVATGGSGSYTYQWLKNDGDISDATFSTYTINPFLKTDVGAYSVSINDGIDTIGSDYANLSYTLTIDTQPQSQVLAIGAPLTLSVGVSGGSGPYTYQWKKNTVNISGATSSTYTINHSALSDAGSYTVSVGDGTDTVLSSAAVISYGFGIVVQPMPQGTYLGGTIFLSVSVAGGSGSYTYQWEKDSSNISDATNSSYTINSFDPLKNAGLYSVSTGDGTTTLLSDAVPVGSTLTINTGIGITQINQNGRLYGTSFIWELDPVTRVPVRVRTVNNF